MIPGYASILHNHLNDEETKLFDGVDLEIDHHKHKPNQVAKCCFKKLMICMIQK
jgi:putative membrane protein